MIEYKRTTMIIPQMLGMTSYIALQDNLSRMLQVKVAALSLSFAAVPFRRRRGSKPDLSLTDIWSWACDRYMCVFEWPSRRPDREKGLGRSHIFIPYPSYHDRFISQDLALPDPMSLPAELADRFPASFTVIIQPLFPILDIESLTQSIHRSYGINSLLHAGPMSQTQLERARDMLILAFVAQVIAGDGDVDCHKDLATVWSETLCRHALKIMNPEDEFDGGVDLIRLWIIYAALSRS